MEEKWLFLYHMSIFPQWTMKLPVAERKWYIERWIQQKEQENEAMKGK